MRVPARRVLLGPGEESNDCASPVVASIQPSVFGVISSKMRPMEELPVGSEARLTEEMDRFGGVRAVRIPVKSDRDCVGVRTAAESKFKDFGVVGVKETCRIFAGVVVGELVVVVSKGLA